MSIDALVEVDARNRLVLPGTANRRYLVQTHEDGSILLQPAVVKTAAQEFYDNSPELQELLARATAAPTVKRARRPRRVV